MGRLSRIKSVVGPVSIKTLASATTLSVPDNPDAVFYVSGTTAVSALSTGTIREGRTIQLIGADVTGTSVTFTDTAIASAVQDQMCLVGGNLTLARGESVTLRQMSGGYWVQTSASGAIG